MTPRALLAACAVFAAALTGCGSNKATPNSLRAAPGLPSLAVYRIDVYQGNVVTPDMLAALQPGMTRERVRQVIGTPMVTDPFHPDRWDYVYSERQGYNLREQRQITLYFADDRLDYVAGDIVPSPGSRYRQLLAANTRTTINVPPAPPSARNLFERVGRKIGILETPPPLGYGLDSYVGTDESGQYSAVTGQTTEGLGPSGAGPTFVRGEPVTGDASSAPADGAGNDARPPQGEPDAARGDPGLFDGLLDRVGL